jgi:hypothetical protein
MDVESKEERKFRMLVDSGILGFTSLFGSVLYFGGLYHLFSTKPQWLIDIIDLHFAAVILPPLMMLGSIVVVIALKMTDGPAKFKLLGFEFEGASAPIIMWVLVYLVMTLSVTVLWGLV